MSMGGQLPKRASQQRVDVFNYLNDPIQQRLCPVCQKEAVSKWWDPVKGKYIYAHKRHYQEAVRHEADR